MNNSRTSRNNYDIFANLQHTPRHIFGNNYNNFSKLLAPNLEFNEEKNKINNNDYKLILYQYPQYTLEIGNKKAFTEIENCIWKQHKQSDAKLHKYSLPINKSSIKDSNNRTDGRTNESNRKFKVFEPELTNFEFNCKYTVQDFLVEYIRSYHLIETWNYT